MFKNRSLSTLALFLSTVLPSFAAPVGAIRGYVHDQSGAIVTNATLILTDEKTGVQQRATTDSTGLYQFLNLNPSTYSVASDRWADGGGCDETYIKVKGRWTYLYRAVDK